MDTFLLVLSIVGIVCSFVFGWVVFIVCRFLLDHINNYRVEQGKRVFPTRLIWVLSLLSGLSFII